MIGLNIKEGMNELRETIHEMEKRKKEIGKEKLREHMAMLMFANLMDAEDECEKLSKKFIGEAVPEMSSEKFHLVLSQLAVVLTMHDRDDVKNSLEMHNITDDDGKQVDPNIISAILGSQMGMMVTAQKYRTKDKLECLVKSIEGLKNLMVGSSDPVIADGCTDILKDMEAVLKEV